MLLNLEMFDELLDMTMQNWRYLELVTVMLEVINHSNWIPTDLKQLKMIAEIITLHRARIHRHTHDSFRVFLDRMVLTNIPIYDLRASNLLPAIMLFNDPNYLDDLVWACMSHNFSVLLEYLVEIGVPSFLIKHIRGKCSRYLVTLKRLMKYDKKYISMIEGLQVGGKLVKKCVMEVKGEVPQMPPLRQLPHRSCKKLS